jgi:hypothetical protein
MKKNIYIAIICLCVAGCNTNDNVSNLPDEIQSPEKTPQAIQEIIYTKSSKYARFFDSNVDREVSYGSSREHPMHIRDFSAHERKIIVDAKAEGINKLSTTGGNTETILINGKTIDNLNNLHSNIQKVQSQKASDNTTLNDFYGRDVSFEVKTTKLINDRLVSIDTSVVLYVPKMAEIAYPKSHQSLYPVCYHDRYRLQWDKDERNDIGMVVIVEWDGSMLEGETEDTYIRRIDIVEDNGETVIKPEMFDNIPHLAIARVSILRGNIEIAELTEDMVYKFYAESNASLNTIILKEEIDLN